MKRCLLLASLLSACSSASAPSLNEITTVRLEVDYEDGAEPYTGAAGPTNDLWSLTRSNLEALMPSKQLNVPSELAQMGALGALEGEAYDAERILQIAQTAQDAPPEADEIVYHLIWLDGVFVDEEGVQKPQVLGVSLGDTRVIGMFKPAIESLGVLPLVRRFGEQSTIIHEVGHAVGLVNNGAPMVRPHQDAEHGAHCDDDRCVMFWANEGAGELADFVAEYVSSGDTVLFDDDCLADVQALLGD